MRIACGHQPPFVCLCPLSRLLAGTPCRRRPRARRWRQRWPRSACPTSRGGPRTRSAAGSGSAARSPARSRRCPRCLRGRRGVAWDTVLWRRTATSRMTAVCAAATAPMCCTGCMTWGAAASASPGPCGQPSQAASYPRIRSARARERAWTKMMKREPAAFSCVGDTVFCFCLQQERHCAPARARCCCWTPCRCTATIGLG